MIIEPIGIQIPPCLGFFRLKNNTEFKKKANSVILIVPYRGDNISSKRQKQRNAKYLKGLTHSVLVATS